jgi:hypothetical protein
MSAIQKIKTKLSAYFGLSPKCRLVVVLRGDTETKWGVEGFENGAWTTDSETGLLLQPFWRSARVEYRQNRVIDAGDPQL